MFFNAFMACRILIVSVLLESQCKDFSIQKHKVVNNYLKSVVAICKRLYKENVFCTFTL